MLTAALLHDLGHGPFSHAFEKITNDRHERRTIEIITSDETEVNRVLREHSAGLPEKLKVFFDENIEDTSTAADSVAPFLTQIVSSQLDADRFDYLLRDSYATGSDSGRLDVEWLIEHLEVDLEKGRLYLQSKALIAAEAYVFARYHMYRTVYYHKTTRSAEVMLKMLFTRYKRLLDQCGDDKVKQRQVVPDASPTIVRAFTSRILLADYLMLDDHSMTEFGKACLRSEDKVLQFLADGLLSRRLLKALDVTESDPAQVVKFYETAKAIVSKKSEVDVDYCFASDSPSDTAYKPYDPDADKPATQIYLQNADGSQQELSRLSENVQNLTKPYRLTRFYFPEIARETIRSEALPLLFKD